MALEVTVGPPVLTINNGHTFLVSELDGSITPASDQGLYSADTRYLSGYQLFINGKSWTLLNSGAMAYYASQTHLVNPMVVTEEGCHCSGNPGPSPEPHTRRGASRRPGHPEPQRQAPALHPRGVNAKRLRRSV
jgi:hypothetical protein